MEKLNGYLNVAAKQAGRVFFYRVLAYFLGFITQVVYVRFLGTKEYGVFTGILAIVNFVVLLIVFGLPTGLTKYLSTLLTKGEYCNTWKICSFSIKLETFLSAVACCGYVLFSLMFVEKYQLLYILSAFLIIISALTGVFNGVLMGLKLPSISVFYTEFMKRVLTLLFFIGFYFFMSKSNVSLIAANLIASIVILIVLSKFVGEFLKKFKRDCRKKSNLMESHVLRRDFIKYSFTMWLVGFTYFMISQVNLVILKFLSSPEEVAYYSIGNTLSGLVVFFLVSVNSIFAPLISELYTKGNKEVLKNMYSTLTRWITTFTLPLFLWFLIFSHNFLYVYRKDVAENASLVLILLCIGQFVNAVVGSNGLILAMTKHQNFEFFNGLIVGGLNLLLNFLLVPKFGSVGAAIGGMIAISMVNIIKSFEVYYLLKMQPYNKEFLKPAVNSGVIVLVYLTLRPFFSTNPIFLGLTLLVGYAVMIALYWLEGITEEDKFILEKFAKKIGIKK